jgi:glycosyltransferase involved in cell wall biosynthesis
MSLAPDSRHKQAGTSPDLGGIRIARISTVPFFVIAQLSTQIETLGDCGAVVTVISSHGPELMHMNRMKNAAWKVIEIPRSFAPLKDVVAMFQLFRLFRREGIQIAHSTTPKAGILTALAAYLARVPVRVHTFTGQPWVSLSGFKRWVVRGCDRLIGVLNTACYADSGSQRDFLLAQGLLKAGKLSVIGNGSLAGVDVLRFSKDRFPPERCVAVRSSIGIPEHVAVLLFVGRITAEKGVREMMAAYAALKSSGSDAHLVIVGNFDDDGGLPGIITRDEISQHPDTHIVGYTDCPESYMAIADILCLPSYREGFGTVVIEAAAMGVPTVGTRIYGLTDAVDEGQTGLLVAPRNSEVLFAALQILLKDVPMRERMGRLAMQRAHTFFDARTVNSAVVQNYISLMRQEGVGQDSVS